MSLPRLRAPQDDGQILVHPPPSSIGQLLDQNRAILSGTGRVFGRPLADFRSQAIAEAVAAARTYLAEAGEPIFDVPADSLAISGHQPDLFHPGVWLKTFMLSSIARRHGTAALNLIVDNDTVKHTAIAVPHWDSDPAQVKRLTVGYDAFSTPAPFEERTIHDATEFAEFPDRANHLTSIWPAVPLLAPFWEEVQRARGRTTLIGELFSTARRTFERRWGCHNLEVPLSRLCQTASFAEFALGMLRDLPSLYAAYNGAVAGYRKRHRIRSSQHPVPDLARDGDWLEAPFWAWRAGATRRERLFVRAGGGRLHLRAGRDAWPDLPGAGDTAAWQKLEREGFKIRTRALTTTLFARLLLADLFVHGIGGGKYDELNDELMVRLFHLKPPTFLVATGTLLLPLPRFPGRADQLRSARRAVRDLDWNPQRYVTSGDGRARHAALVQQRPMTRSERREHYNALRSLNAQIRPLVESARGQAAERAEQLTAEVAANAILSQRDFAFVLYPQEKLIAFCAQIQGLA